MKRIVSLSNRVFAAAILAIFYFTVVGFSYLLLKIKEVISGGEKKAPHWENPKSEDKNFTSPY